MNEALHEEQMTDIERMRHSLAHIMAMAVKQLYPETQVTIGPPVENGFYYDFDRAESFTEQDLEAIEARMRLIIEQNLPFERAEMPSSEAIALFEGMGEHYKAEIIRDLNVPMVSTYRNGDFIDLCRGPHVTSTGSVGCFKLTSVAGAYWRGDEHNKMLQRIYAVAFATEQELQDHLTMLEEAKKRDHRKLGRELDLFSFQEDIGPGLVLYHPKGTVLRMMIENFEKEEHVKRGYQQVMGPHILNTNVWRTSGHYQMGYPMYFFEIDGQEYGIKPMNCPAHVLLFKSGTRSYRDLPIRYFELGTVHRYEKSGVLHGLLRARAFTQDDAHIFCLPEQLQTEIVDVMRFVEDTFRVFGFDHFDVELSTRPDKSIGSDDMWEQATDALRGALDELKQPYEVNEGDGAFYGPKIDVKLRDALGRIWQCATIQCDFALPDRFDASYIGSDGKKHRPVMVHRAILGSLERFMGILIEHYGGAFPLWMAPVQAKILPIAERHADYAKQVAQQMQDLGLRVELDLRNEKIGFKIREGREQRVPYLLVVGDKEMEAQTVAVRQRSVGDRGPMAVSDLLAEMQTDVADRVIW